MVTYQMVIISKCFSIHTQIAHLENQMWLENHLQRLDKMEHHLPSSKRLQRSTIFNRKIHYKWPFSIALLNYQRV